MYNKLIIKMAIITVILILVFIAFDRCSRNFVNNITEETSTPITETEKIKYEYSLDEPPIKYGVDVSKSAKTEYFEYLKQYIKPNELLDFISEKNLYDGFYDESGNKMIEWLFHRAYGNMIRSMFDINRTDFNDCAVTENFIEKFNTNLNSYFDIGGEDCNIEVYTDDKTIKYTKWWNLGPDGDPANGWLYVFKYILDEEGNVDDIVLDYDTGSF